MPIPDADSHGLLPVGVHDCTLDEVRERFGTFQSSDRRPSLFRRLVELAATMKQSGLFESLLIDGSFVTAKPAPNDIDAIAVLHSGHDFERELSMTDYALVSRVLLRRRFGFDVIIAELDGPVYKSFVEFFSRVREAPGLRKGLLRVAL